MTDLGAQAPGQPGQVVRLALVLNGGVSLAVWMGGVTHELDRLLARLGPATASPAWTAILKHRGGDCSVVVDYVAGTSAGGLNGTLLAAAIARGAPLAGIRELWLDKGRLQVNRAARDDDAAVDGLLPDSTEAGTSLLDGSYFEGAVEEALDSIRPRPGARPGEVTLLVTATAMTASPLMVADAYSNTIKATDHRRVYKFTTAQRSETGTDDFASGPSACRVPGGTGPDASQDPVPGTGETVTSDLALAARASAGFPGAFAPVAETRGLLGKRTRRSRDFFKDSWLIDGGVLDNAPFEPLLDEITRNPRPDAGERWVVYVVPSAVTAGTEHHLEVKTNAAAPAWLPVVRKLWGLKGEVDLRSDVEALRDLQFSSRSMHQRPEALIELPPLLTAEQISVVLQQYQRTRAAGFIQFLNERSERIETLKRIQVSATDVQELLEEPTAYFVPTELAPTREDGSWQWGATVASRLVLWMSRSVRSHGSAPGKTIGELAEIESQVRRIETAVTRVYEGLAGADLELVSPMTVVNGRHQEVLPLMAPLPALMDHAVTLWVSTLDVSPQDPWAQLLSVEVLLNFAQLHGRTSLPEFDVVLADPGTMPEALVDLEPNSKLYGTRLGHFGAFGHTDYRQHDWLWGRVDGALCLANALLNGSDGDRERELKDALVADIMLDAGTTLDDLVAQTRAMANLDDQALLIDILRRGEVDTDGLVESIERAMSQLAEGSRVAPAIDAVADAAADALAAAARAGEGVIHLLGWLDRVKARVSSLRDRIWP